MVVAAKYTGRLVTMTALSIVLVAFSLSASWFIAETSHKVNGQRVTDQKVAFYPDYYEQYPSSYSSVYRYSSDSYVAELMSNERFIIEIWILVGICFIGTCLLDFKELSTGSALLLMIVGVAAIVLFVGRMPHALDYDGSYGRYGFPEHLPFIGSVGDTTSMPGLGFWLVLWAAIMQVAVGIVKTKIEVFDRKKAPKPVAAPSVPLSEKEFYP